MFKILQESIAGISTDRRIQLLLVAFSFGAFFEGAADFGAPVAVTGVMLIGLGLSPLAATGLSLIANTAPVAFAPQSTDHAPSSAPVHTRRSLAHIQRGNNRAVCFYAEQDYQFYLHYLKEFAEQFGCAVHAYVLMTNHVHLLFTPHRSDSAALLMKHLGQRYVQYINRTYRRSGALWEGRFRSCLMQSEDYV